MPPKRTYKTKQASNAERPFPWRCRHCGKQEVVLQTIEYQAEIRHDGRLHSFTIPALEIPVCQACGEKVFTEKVDAQETEALRAHLNLLTPAQIHDEIKRVGMSQKDVAARLGIAEATLSRWLNETQIQSRAMDNLLRVFFTVPEVRQSLRESTREISFDKQIDSYTSHETPQISRMQKLRKSRGAPVFYTREEALVYYVGKKVS